MSTITGRAAPIETRKLAAIMFTDIVGFSRQMGSDEARTLRLLDVHNQIIQQSVAEHHGTIRVEDNQPVGSRFVVRLPLSEVAAGQRVNGQSS